MIWPKWVWSLTPSESLQGRPSGVPGEPPVNFVGWVDQTILEAIQRPDGTYDVDNYNVIQKAFFDQWHRIFRAVRESGMDWHRSGYNGKGLFTIHDWYNASWARLGYRINQSPSVLKLVEFTDEFEATHKRKIERMRASRKHGIKKP